MATARMGAAEPWGDFGVRFCDAPMQAGDVVDGHAHNFPHLTYVQGALRFELLGDDDTVERTIEKVSGPAEPLPFVLILAGRRHRLTALVDGTRYQCLYLHRDEGGAPVPHRTGWEDAYV